MAVPGRYPHPIHPLSMLLSHSSLLGYFLPRTQASFLQACVSASPQICRFPTCLNSSVLSSFWYLKHYKDKDNDIFPFKLSSFPN